MISKFAVYGADREQAIERMRRALMEYQIGGIKTTLLFFREVMNDPEFVAGNLDTGFITAFNERRAHAEPDQVEQDLAIIAAALASGAKKDKPAGISEVSPSRWARTYRAGQPDGF
jgi:acetyl-CoA carboxylase biotin carboxylase subunit